MTQRNARLTTIGILSILAGSANAATIELVPNRANGIQGIDWVLGPNPNEITLRTGGQLVEIFVRISDFAPHDIAAYQTGTECADFVAGEFEALNLVCPNNGDFDAMFCMGVDESQPDYVLAEASGTLPACQSFLQCPGNVDGQFDCGSVLLFGPPATDEGISYYANQFAYTLSTAARGSYTVNLSNDPDRTLIRDSMAREVTISRIIPAVITIPVGACCYAGGILACEDATLGACDAAGGVWLEDVECTGHDSCNLGIDDACPCCDVDQDCDDGNACTADSCSGGGCCGCENSDITPPGFCCEPPTGALHELSDGNDCTDDICLPNDAIPVDHPPFPPGTPCDDANACTANDQCDGMGSCIGTDINTVHCETIQDCPAGAQACLNGECICALTTKLTLDAQDGSYPDPTCFEAGETVSIDVVMEAGSACVTGAQVLLDYDTNCLAFQDFNAGPYFALEIYQDVDEDSGTAFGAVGLVPGSPCTMGPELIATFDFTTLDNCNECVVSFSSINPQNTILTDDAGNAVPLDFNNSRSLRLAGNIELHTPTTDWAVHPDCDVPVAHLAWPAISATSECEGNLDLDCTAIHGGGVNIDHLTTAGGLFPQGTSTFTCQATTTCGNSRSQQWQVEVSDQHEFQVEVQLSPIMMPAPLTRAVCFDFYRNCVQEPIHSCHDLLFGGPLEFPGHATVEMLVPKGQYACITAKDPLHSLRSVSDINCVENRLVAEFKGDPEFGGNWLVNGNLDCRKADGNGDVIDVLDFGMFASQYLEELDPNTPIGTPGPHGDINGDGIVDGADFSIIAMNYEMTSKNACCDDATATAPRPVHEISMKQLRATGLEMLNAADLNHDGMLSKLDIVEFMKGNLPKRNGSRK